MQSSLGCQWPDDDMIPVVVDVGVAVDSMGHICSIDGGDNNNPGLCLDYLQSVD